MSGRATKNTKRGGAKRARPSVPVTAAKFSLALETMVKVAAVSRPGQKNCLETRLLRSSESQSKA